MVWQARGVKGKWRLACPPPAYLPDEILWRGEEPKYATRWNKPLGFAIRPEGSLRNETRRHRESMAGLSLAAVVAAGIFVGSGLWLTGRIYASGILPPHSCSSCPPALISTIKPMINCLEVFSDVSSLVPGGADWTSLIFGLIGYYCV